MNTSQQKFYFLTVQLNSSFLLPFLIIFDVANICFFGIDVLLRVPRLLRLFSSDFKWKICYGIFCRFSGQATA